MPPETVTEWKLPESLAELAREGDEELVADILTSFQTDGEARLRRLESAVAMADRALIRLQAHTLKGGALQVGADVVALLCKDLEIACATESIGEMTSRLMRIEWGFATVCRAMEHRIVAPQ